MICCRTREDRFREKKTWTRWKNGCQKFDSTEKEAAKTNFNPAVLRNPEVGPLAWAFGVGLTAAGLADTSDAAWKLGQCFAVSEVQFRQALQLADTAWKLGQ